MTEPVPDSQQPDSNGIAMRFGPYRLLRSQRLLLDGTRPVPMSSRAMDILLALVEQPGQVLSRDDLITRAWPNSTVDDVNLRVHVSALRRALGDGRDGQPYLVTIPGRGYRFVGALASEATPLLAPGALPRARPASLPMPLARIIGRAEIIQRISTLLPQRGCITLVGPGGMGKTAVATAVADSVGPSYEDGVQWVDLATLDRDDTVPAAVAFSLGIANFSIDASPGIVASLHDRQLLLVLDSCERVVTGAAELMERIRVGAPAVHILATSREPLRARGEHVVRLPPLGLPREIDAQRLSVTEALSYPAVQLFVERASAIVDGFTLNESNVSLVANICSRLDGIALAIELAAGHLAAFELQSLASLLDHRFRLIAAGRRTSLPRHRTMQATLEWSYETLPDQERLLLRRLAVFGGAATLPAILAVAALADEAATVAALMRLVDKSLVTAEADDAEVRYRLLDTTRAFALDKLSGNGELTAISRRHAEYYSRFLRTTDAWNDGPGGYSAELAADLANIRAALDWSALPDGDPSLYVTLTIAAVPLWTQLSLLGECRTRVNEALAALQHDAANGPAREMALHAALGISLMYTQGPVDESEPIWARVLDLAESMGDVEYQLRALYGLWLYRILICEYRTALTLAERFRQIAGNGAPAGDLATSERMIGIAQQYLGDQTAARACAERSLAAPLPPNRHVHAAHYGLDQRVGTFVLLSRSLWLQGLPDQATRAAQIAIDEASTVGHANSMCVALADGAGVIAILNGDVAAAGTFAGMLAGHADRHALGVWRTYAMAMRGRLLVHSDALAGAALLRDALRDLHGTPFDIRFQLYLLWLAMALAAAGRTAEGLAAINEAIERAERSEERWHFAELLRIRGDLLLAENAAEADRCFAQSLDWARRQGALSWELRTATSLVRARPDQAAVLAAVLDRFSEGLGTADVLAAQRLLSSHRDGRHGGRS